MTLWGAASWWQITSVSGGGGPNERQTAPGGGRKPYWASWNIRSICATVVSASSVTQCGAKGYSPHSPSRNDSTSRPRSSMPRARGAPVKPTYSRWRSRAWTAGVQGPALRRTVSPFRTTKEVFPPWSGINPLLKEVLAEEEDDRNAEDPAVSALCQSFLGKPNPYDNPAPNVDQIVND